MKVISIDIDELRDYVYSAIIDDDEIVEFFDKNVPVKNTLDAIDSICEKIKRCYPYADFFGVELESEKIGFFVYSEELLISFGVCPKYRNKEVLSNFWDCIKKVLPEKFQCVLYSHNKRALDFLKRGGMKVMFDTVTILIN